MPIENETYQSLRQRAEAIATQNLAAESERTPEEMRKLVHELQVHQIELELQNDELQRALTDLERSQRQFFNLFNQAPVGYLVLDDVGLIRQANDTFLQMCGCERGFVLGQPLADLIAPPDRQVFLARFRAFFRKPEGKSLEACLAGTNIYTRMEGALLRESLGLHGHTDTPQLLLTVSDITQRRQAEEAQRQSEEKFRQLAENIRQVFWLRERVSGKIIYISPAYEAIWGRERSDLYANPSAFLENVHPEDLQRVLAAQKAQHEKGQLFNQQFRLIRPDGQMRWIWARTFPVYNTNGLVIRYAGLADDITEARRSEEILLARLRLQEFSMTCSLDALMQRIMDEICVLVDSPIGFFHFLQEDQKTLTLQAWSTRTVQEFCTAEAKGHTYEVAKAGVWVDCIEARQPVIHNDYASLPHRKGLPEGHAALIRQLVVPIFRCDQIVAILGVGNKAYDYNQADADIISRLADFAWDILERRRTEIALQESLAENQLLLRELQHRVKNSMGMIASIVSLETFGAAHPAVTEALESLHRRILTMANLYTHLYDSGNTQTVRLDQYIQQIVHSLETAFVGDVHGGTIQAHLDEVTVNVRAASPFGLIVNELVTNALKYAFPASQRGTIIVRLQHADGALTLQVQDDGIGLPDDFDIARSTGLGMQLVQGLSGQLGGALTYESKRGAIFRLRIPMHTLV